ncbi:hypothetical protein DFQ28_006034 [Apophysomyces sp. BC1034]|nr:hypothetical protein DFQ28_006034 [Apophysomyces sp. BC1034]
MGNKTDWNRTYGLSEPQQVVLSWTSNAVSFRVQFTTLEPVDAALMKYWRKDSYEPATYITESEQDWTFVDGGSENRTIYQHILQSYQLARSGLYAYQVASVKDDEYMWSEVFEFHTRDDEAFSFLAMADMGVANAASMPSLMRAARSGFYDFVTILGDQAYDLSDLNGRKGDEYMNFVQPVYANVPVLATPGNHEAAYNFSHFKNRFNLMPYRESHYENAVQYSFDYRSLHITSISTEVYFNGTAEEIETAQNWIVRDLHNAQRNPEIRWIIVIGHRPLYCTPIDDPDCGERGQLLRDALEPLFLRYHVDLYLCGHVHNYERTYPIVDDQLQSYSYLNPPSFFQVISGNSGNYHGIDPVGLSDSPPPWVAFRYHGYGFSTININPTKLELFHWRSFPDGTASLEDKVTVIKSTTYMNRALLRVCSLLPFISLCVMK